MLTRMAGTTTGEDVGKRVAGEGEGGNVAFTST